MKGYIPIEDLKVIIEHYRKDALGKYNPPTPGDILGQMNASYLSGVLDILTEIEDTADEYVAKCGKESSPSDNHDGSWYYND